MDCIFDCFFEQTFMRLERSSLQMRKKRNDVIDHLNSIIEGCSQGQDILPEESALLAIISAIKYHKTKKEENGNVCLMGKYHNILYIAIKVSWDWDVKDSEIIKELLEEIYSCEMTFERIFLGAIFGSNAPHFIAGWRSDFKNQEDNIRAMVYYLNHAAQTSLEFPFSVSKSEITRMVKFVDIPIESCGRSSPMRVALQASAPDLFLILMRHGASPTPPDGGMPPLIALLDKLLDYQDSGSYPFQLASCLRILMKSLPSIDFPFKPCIFEIRRNMFIERYGKLVQDHLLLADEIYGVADLKHLCRCIIRQQLRANSKLPQGINELRVPPSLKRYIDLLDDEDEACEGGTQ